ncbi:hypothetical protein NPIL_623471 [Nephila pilipes]|uniref:Uncharacterized protein n=1 Tax=Nephila pilipes TaxID=299642 RepID=A0A8X6Q691_NEPPI|nr:hypothetical protein NPIL_623471 [Nephila pilipes]
MINLPWNLCDSRLYINTIGIFQRSSWDPLSTIQEQTQKLCPFQKRNLLKGPKALPLRESATANPQYQRGKLGAGVRHCSEFKHEN